MSQFLGRVKVKVNGQVQDSKPGASIDIGGIMRNSVVNDHSMGFSEEPKPASIEAELALKRGVSLEDIRNFTNGTCVFECDTGQSYIVRNAYTSNTLSISSGSVKVVFMGEPAEEIVS